MTADDFRRIALSLPDTEERSHVGAPDFRVDGHIFATLAAEKQGYGNLMLTPEVQQAFLAERPEMFRPVHGGWGRMGATHVLLALADEDTVAGALRTAWRIRREKNAHSGKKKTATTKKGSSR